MEYQIDQDVDFSTYKKTLAENCSPNSLLAERVFRIYGELDTPDKKDIFNIVVAKDILSQSSDSPMLQKLQSMINTLETFKATGQLEQVMSVVSFFVVQQKNLYVGNEDRKNKFQTQNATKSRQDDLLKRCLAIEEFLQQVELLRHPRQEQTEVQPKRNAAYSEKIAVRTVFRDNESNIVEKLKTCGIETDFEKEFGNCFRFYTDFYISNTGKTYSGYTKEKRSSRSDESKKRSSASAVKAWKKRRKNQ